MKKIVFLLFVFLIIFSSAFCYSKSVVQDLSSYFLRLHIIANSDSAEDLDLKYKVRDSLLNYMENLSKDIITKEEAISLVNEHLQDFKQIAQNTINENGFSYSCNVYIKKLKFPTKTYGEIKLPAGYYDALEVEIGEGKGHNWWCVMFPPLCFVNLNEGIIPEESKNELKTSLSSDNYNLIFEKDATTEIRFKLVELFQKIF